MNSKTTFGFPSRVFSTQQSIDVTVKQTGESFVERPPSLKLITPRKKKSKQR
jgi:hypothetical protein